MLLDVGVEQHEGFQAAPPRQVLEHEHNGPDISELRAVSEIDKLFGGETLLHGFQGPRRSGHHVIASMNNALMAIYDVG